MAPCDEETGKPTNASTSDCRTCANHIKWCYESAHFDENDRPIKVTLEECMDQVAGMAQECGPAGCRYACSLCSSNESKKTFKANLGLPMNEPAPLSGVSSSAEVSDNVYQQSENAKKKAAAEAAEAARKAQEAQDKAAADTAATGAVPTAAATGAVPAAAATGAVPAAAATGVDYADAEQKIKDDIEKRTADDAAKEEEIAAAEKKEKEEKAEEEKKRVADANKAAADATDAAKKALEDASAASTEKHEAALQDDVDAEAAPSQKGKVQHGPIWNAKHAADAEGDAPSASR
jgi:hypothetical protein